MAKFRRAHYIAIAHILGERYRREALLTTQHKGFDGSLGAIRLLVADFIHEFSVDSSSFDAQKFAEAFKAKAGF